MLYFIWGIFNISIGVYFLIVCFKSIRLIRERFGILATLVFLIGISSFLNFKKPEENVKIFNFENQKIKNLNCSSSKSEEICLEQNLATNISFHTTFGEINNAYKPINSFSYLSGFISGLEWHPKDISINSTQSKNKFDYMIYGCLKWNLFGFTIFTEAKEYKGFINLNNK